MASGFISAILAGHGGNSLKASVAAVLAGHGCNHLVTSAIFDAIDAQFAFVPWPLASCLQPNVCAWPEDPSLHVEETISDRFGGSVPNISDDDRVGPPSTPDVSDVAKGQSPLAVRRNRKRKLAWSEGNFANICRRYFRKGACKYGESCRLDHLHNSSLLGKAGSTAESRDSSDSDLPAATDAASEDGAFVVKATSLIPPFPPSGGEQNLCIPSGVESGAVNACDYGEIEETASLMNKSAAEESSSYSFTLQARDSYEVEEPVSGPPFPALALEFLAPDADTQERVLAELRPATSENRSRTVDRVKSDSEKLVVPRSHVDDQPFQVTLPMFFLRLTEAAGPRVLTIEPCRYFLSGCWRGNECKFSHLCNESAEAIGEEFERYPIDRCGICPADLKVRRGRIAGLSAPELFAKFPTSFLPIDDARDLSAAKEVADEPMNPDASRDTVVICKAEQTGDAEETLGLNVACIISEAVDAETTTSPLVEATLEEPINSSKFDNAEDFQDDEEDGSNPHQSLPKPSKKFAHTPTRRKHRITTSTSTNTRENATPS